MLGQRCWTPAQKNPLAPPSIAALTSDHQFGIDESWAVGRFSLLEVLECPEVPKSAVYMRLHACD